MTGPTHRRFSVCFAYISAIIFFKIGVSEINYYLTIPILLTVSKFGSEFPDLDHSWNNVHNKTVLRKVINVLIHITGGKHRSWQTHSIDIFVIITFGLLMIPIRAYNAGLVSAVNSEVMKLLVLGFASGWVSHLFSDSLTSEGVRLFCWNNKIKIKLVPKKIGKLRFNTGNDWEKFVFSLIQHINNILGIICILYPTICNTLGI